MDKGSRVNRYRVDKVSRKGGSEKKRKLLAKVRDQKNQNILSADTVDSEDSSDDDDEETMKQKSKRQYF